MKKTVCLIISLICMQCNTSKKLNTLEQAEVLSDCLNNEDIDLLNEGIRIFEEHLKRYYGNSQISGYKGYLNSLSTMSFDRSFFQSKESINFLVKLKKSRTFKILYKLYEEPKYDDIEIAVPITSREKNVNEEKKKLPNIYVINEKGAFSSCLRKESTVKDLKDYFEDIKDIPDISPIVKAGAFIELFKTLKEDVNIVKLSITFDLYYGSLFMINRI